MYRIQHLMMTSAALALGFVALPADAAGLLGGVVGGGGSGSAVTVQSGPAASSGLVNVGLGGGDGNVADVRLGGDGLGGTDSATLADINISSGGDNGLVDASAELGGLASANAIVDGNGAAVDVDLGGLDGVIGVGGVDGAPGVNGAPGGAGGAGGAGGGFFNYGGAGMGANCVGPDGKKILHFAATHGYTAQSFAAWGAATNIKLVAIKLCPAARQALARALLKNGGIHGLQAAVASDLLINASLHRAHSTATHVLAVTQKGTGLAVYVY